MYFIIFKTSLALLLLLIINIKLFLHPPLISTDHTPPLIKAHPESIQVNSGEVVEMVVEAEGTNLTYQWYKDGLPYPGLTQSKITLTDVQEPSTGLYYCCVKNPHGSANSHPARVDIIPMKLKLPPSLQGAGPNYSSLHLPSMAASPFSPPPNVQTKSNDALDLLLQESPRPYFKKEMIFTSSLSGGLENMRIENGWFMVHLILLPVYTV